MKKLLISLIATLALSLSGYADNVMVEVPANTSSNLLSVPVITDEITFTATTATSATVRLYDSATTTTTKVQAAYTSYSTYATNFSATTTNTDGVLITNTFVGTYTVATVNSASTSSITPIMTVVIPGSTQRVKTAKLQVMRGLTAVSSAAVLIEVDYRKNP